MVDPVTRNEAERLCRQVISSHAGEPMADNLFNESVEMLMKEAELIVQDNGQDPLQHK